MVKIQTAFPSFTLASDCYNAWEKMGIQWSSISALYGLQESLWFSQEGGLIYTSHWVWYPCETGRTNKNVSDWNI
jgi:hypothetical protein